MGGSLPASRLFRETRRETEAPMIITQTDRSTYLDVSKIQRLHR
jgi:hypothetical protein